MTNQAAQTMPELAADDPIIQMRMVVQTARANDALISRAWVSGWADQWEAERAAAILAVAPAASGIHPDALPDGTLSKSTAKRLAAASVSERARDERFTAMLIGIIDDVQDELGFTDEDKECSNGSLEIVAAIRELKEQALTQQRGEREDAHKFRRLAQLLDGFDFRLGRNALMPPATYLDSVEITCEFQPGIGQSVIDAIVDVLATEKRND